MKDGTKIWAGLAASLIIIFADTALLLATDMPMALYWVFFAVGLAIAFVPFALIRGDWVTLDADCVRIRAPLANLDIPYSSITEISCVDDFDVGLRTMGYGGLHRGSGSFNNRTLGSYTLAGDTRIPKMIVVRYDDNGRSRCAAFNMVDALTTVSAYQSIKVASEAGSLRVDPEAKEGAEKSHRTRTRALAAVVVVAAVVIVAAIALATTMGHVDVTADDDYVSIDATMVHEDIPYSSITSVELRDDVDYGHRVAGLSNGGYLTGDFRNDEFGDYQLAVHRDVDLCVVIHWSGGVMVVNCGDAGSTEELYSELLSHVGTVGWGYNATPIYSTCGF